MDLIIQMACGRCETRKTSRSREVKGMESPSPGVLEVLEYRVQFLNVLKGKGAYT
jgi:hypothetical protein